MLCQSCTKMDTCKEICKDMAKYLRSLGIKSSDWIRPEVSKEKRKDGLGRSREVPFSSLDFDINRYDGNKFH